MLDPVALREHSRATVRELGFPDPPVHLPILWEVDEGYSNRPVTEVVERLAALNIVVARSFGMPVSLASDWLDANDIRRVLTEAEVAVIAGDDSTTVEIQAEVEAIWAFAWALGLADQLDATRPCEDDLVRRLPDLKDAESLTAWRGRQLPALRKADEVMTQLDLHYCLTWGLAEANLRNRPAPGAVEQNVIWQRRRALEFIIAEREWGHGDWDDIDLST